MILPYIGQEPTRAHHDDAGLDLRANTPHTIPSGEWKLIPTGTQIAIPEGMVGLVCPRSGLAAKHGVTVLNAPGIVDAGYRGDIGVILINHGHNDFRIQEGDRIAQLVIQRFEHLIPQQTSALESTKRGEAGFGSAGKLEAAFLEAPTHTSSAKNRKRRKGKQNERI